MDAQTALIVPLPRAVPTEPPDIFPLVTDWHAALDLRVRSGNLSDTSRKTYTIGMNKFVEWCGKGRVVITEELLLEWIAYLRAHRKKYKVDSINAWYAGVRAFFAWATGANHIPYNPTVNVQSSIRSRASRKHKRDILTNAEVRRVLAMPDTDEAKGKRDQAIITLMCYAGVRTIEVHRADISDLRTSSGKLVLAVTGKGRSEGDEIVVLAHAEVENAMHNWLAVRGNRPGALFISMSPRSSGNRLSLSAIRHIVKDYFKAAGVVSEAKTTHSLRHTAASSSISHGAPVPKAQTMLRHADPKTTMIYYHEVDRITNPAEAYISYDD